MLIFVRQLKLYWLILIKYLQRNFKIGFWSLLFLFALIFVQNKFNIIDLNSNIIRQGFIGTYQEHDLPVEVTSLISKPLVKPDENNRIIANLVTGWETNKDVTNFKFKLKEGLKWGDGTFIKSSDIEFPIENAVVTYPDDKTLEFQLKEPYSPFPSLLNKPIFKKGTLIGVGPYKVTKLEKSRIFITKISLKPVFDTNLPDVVVRFYPNEKLSLTGFKMGEIQSLSGVNTTTDDNALVKYTQRTDYGKIVAIFYNTKDAVLANRSLRQALSYSAPLIEGEVEANNPLPPFSWGYEKNTKDYLGKTNEAKVALDRAKGSMNEDAFEKEIILTATPQLEYVGNKVVAAWKELGLKAVLRVESGIPQNFQALLITQSIPIDPDQYFLWHSTQISTNLAKYSPQCCPQSARADKNLEDGRKLFEEKERKLKYTDLQNVLLEDSPATFLYFPKYNVLYLKKVEDKINKILPLQLPLTVRN